MKRKTNISDQVKAHTKRTVEKDAPYDGNAELVISTGSTLLDLAISGGRIRGGGIPGGIIVELFGPSSIGKTAMLCEVAGNVRRRNGQTKFMDPEARLSAEFAKIFGLELEEDEVEQPDTPVEVFKPIRQWNPEPGGVIHGVFIDSTAALASDLEMEDKKDEYSRRAKLFSQECRKTCRIITKKNFLVMCSNQLRQNVDSGGFGAEKYTSPGGEAFKFYASLRLKATKTNPYKIKKETSFKGKKVERIIGVSSEIEVFKSSVWEPYHKAPIHILFDYGIDDIRANLQYVKSTLGATTYQVDGTSVGQGMDEAIRNVENDRLEKDLQTEVIDLWEEVQEKLQVKRKTKRRT
jgi:protein RecA